MTLFFAFMLSVVVYGGLELDSPAFVLMEHDTGQVLYSRNLNERRYPASLTKMLTALVAYEYLDFEEMIVVGAEIQGMPAGFASNVFAEGDELTVETLFYALLVRSANEAGRIVALNTIRKRENRYNIPFNQAENAFVALMNEKARGLGAVSSNFDNSFGSHSNNHFTTAHDMALITRAFIENPTLARISGTRVFENWTSNNQMLPFAPLGYPYMLGGMTGFTNAAGHIFAGAARQDMQFVTVVLGGTSDGRWLDTRRLMDYGFSNFRFREIARADELLATVAIQNPQRGDSGYLDVVSTQGFTALLHRNTYATIVRDITFDPLLYVDEATLLAPIEQHMYVGTVTYTANGITIFSAPIAAAEDVYAQNFDSDMDYFLARIFGNVFSRRAVPYWFGVFGTIFGLVGIFLTLTADRRAEKKRSIRYTRY